MDKKEAFKGFIGAHPELVSYVKNGNMTFQKFFEIYDIYGEDERAWKEYFTTTETKENSSISMDAITSKLKSIDMNSIQEHIKTAQKALGVIEELTNKGTSTLKEAKNIVPPRPIHKFFED